MLEHAAINEFDLAAVTNAVTTYQSAGLTAVYDASNRSDGIVMLTFSNPIRRDGGLVIFEIHKFRRSGFILKKNHWVIQLWSVGTLDAAPQRKGCAFGSMLVRALTMAELDVQANFLSVVTFAMAERA